MPDRLSSNVRLGNFFHFDRSLDAGGDAPGFQASLESDGVHHGREHPDIVGGGAVQAGGGLVMFG